MVRLAWIAAILAVTIAASAGSARGGQETATGSPPRLEKTFLQLGGMG